MERDFCSYEQALALKELGFREDVLAWYDTENKLLNTGSLWQLFKNDDDVVLAPLKQQVFRWFREKYNLWSYVYPYIHDKDWHFHIQFYNSEMWGEIHLGNKFNTYEEAENACIDKLIEIANSQKDIDVPLSKQQSND